MPATGMDYRSCSLPGMRARNSLQKVILRFPSTEAQKTLDKILRIEKEVNR